MKIAIFVGQFPCLSETFIIDQITNLIDRGHDLKVISVEPGNSDLHQPEIARYGLLNNAHFLKDLSGPFANLIRYSGSALRIATKAPARIPSLAANCFPPATRQRQFLRLLNLLNQNIDVVHCHFGPHGALAVSAREILGKRFPVITSFHGSDMRPDDGVARYEQLFRLGDSFIANTGYTRNKLESLGCCIEKIEVVPVGINVDSVPCESPIDRQGHIAGTINLLTVARLVPFKGIGTGIDAVRLLHQSGLKISYTIIGDGPLKAELQALIDEFGLSKIVTLAGPKTREEVFTSFSSSDIFLLPSVEHNGRTETQGLVVQEAQAAGLPVVASRIGGIPEGLSNGNREFLFTPGNASELADRIGLVIDKRSSWPAIARESRQFVRQNYDNAVLAERIESIYEQCKRPI